MDQACCTVADWHASLRARSTNGVTAKPISPASARPRIGIAVFDDTPHEVVQPPLIDDVLCLHRGGTKRVQRFRNGRQAVFDVEPDTLTLLQRGQGARWITEGPIDYVHLTISASVLDEVTENSSALTSLQSGYADRVGFADPLLANLMLEMLRLFDEGEESRLYQESLLISLVLTLVHRSSGSRYNHAAGATSSRIKGGLTAWRLRSVLDYLNAHRTRDIAFEELVRVSGLSRAHFYRTFLQTTGLTPGRYLERLRVDDARRAIERGTGLSETAAAAGFSSQAAMARAFRRALMITPDVYRRCVR